MLLREQNGILYDTSIIFGDDFLAELNIVLIEPQILSSAIPVGMPGLPVSFMLASAEIIVAFRIKSTLDLLKGINNPVFLFLILREVKSLITVPIHILLCPCLLKPRKTDSMSAGNTQY